jgi:AcrR family transcriptional regulator
MPNYSPEMPAKLAESAFQLFSRHGVKQVNLDQVAGNAGVTKGSLYWHFRSKHDVVKAACLHYYGSYHRRMNEEISPIVDPLERLEHTLRYAVRTCLLDAGNRIFTMEVFTMSVHDEDIRRGWQQFYDSVRSFYVGLVKSAIVAGELQVEDPEQAVNVMLATMEGIKLRALFEPEICTAVEENRIVDSLRDILGFRQSHAPSRMVPSKN